MPKYDHHDKKVGCSAQARQHLDDDYDNSDDFLDDDFDGGEETMMMMMMMKSTKSIVADMCRESASP